jgi:hypothetical protein
MDIKNLKPRANSGFIQNYFKPRNPQKYIGDPNKIIYRSSWEARFCSWCDIHPNIKRWSSEPVAIPYVNPVTKKPARYFVDFFVMVEKNGVELQYLIEIKPNSQINPPDKKLLEGNQTLQKIKRYNWQLRTYIINKAKFEAAVEFAKARNMKFAICDEKFLF